MLMVEEASNGADAQTRRRHSIDGVTECGGKKSHFKGEVIISMFGPMLEVSYFMVISVGFSSFLIFSRQFY